VTDKPCVSKRLARSFLRYLQDRVGDQAYEVIAARLPPVAAKLVREGGGADDWIPLEVWLPVLEAFEQRHGSPATWQLLREMTRSCMAVAVAKGWSAFMADITPELLLQRSGTFWQMSYNRGELVVLARGPRRCRLGVEGWTDPPAPVVASVAEACVVFLVRLGERSGRAIEERVNGRAELEVTW
jgi:hypothetical protein